MNILQEDTMSPTTQSMQLAIDECEEWIWDTLDSTKDCGFEYIKDGNKEFLIFNTNDFLRIDWISGTPSDDIRVALIGNYVL